MEAGAQGLVAYGRRSHSLPLSRPGGGLCHQLWALSLRVTLCYDGGVALTCTIYLELCSFYLTLDHGAFRMKIIKGSTTMSSGGVPLYGQKLGDLA